MGMFDTMNQAARSGATGMTGTMGPGMNTQGNGGSFAQKMQMRANPVMQGRAQSGIKPGMAQTAGNVMQAYQKRPVGAGGPRPGGMGGSYNQLLQANPQLANFRETGQKAGQDMSWMDKPGALTMPPPTEQPMPQVQSGLANLMTPADTPPPSIGPSDNPFAAMADQRGEPLEDMGSRDPREQLRMKMLQEHGNISRPDVMPRTGIGPSDELRAMGQPMQPVVMDENGLEPRRGPR